MKLVTTTILWAFALWYVGAVVAAFAGVPDVLGPMMGALAGAIVAFVPRAAKRPEVESTRV